MTFDLRAFGAAPGRRRQLLAATGAVVALIGAFELGQTRAGHNALQAQLAERRLSRQIKTLEAENRARARKLARLETDGKIDREAYTQVEKQLAELQGRIFEQQEEVAFYRGIIGGPGESGLKVQDFALTVAAGSAVNLRFVLAQVERAEREVRGQAQIRVEGTRAGRVVSLDVASLAAGGSAVPLSFSFRYFQELAVLLRLPVDFTPRRVVIRILPATSGTNGSVESFPWAVSGA